MRALQSLGYYHLRGDEAEPGERAVRSAIELIEPLERDHPVTAEYGRRLGRCYDLLGVVGIVSGRSRQYLPHWDRAVAVLERTIARHPEDLEARTFVMKVLYNRGSGLEGLDRYEGAMESDRQAVDQGRQALELVPDNPVIRFDFGMSLEFLATARFYLGWFQSAEQNSTASVELFRALSAASPGVPRYKSWLFHGLSRLAQVQVKLGHQARAESTIREAREFRDRMGPEGDLDRFERQRIAELRSRPVGPSWPNKAVGPRLSRSSRPNSGDARSYSSSPRSIGCIYII